MHTSSRGIATAVLAVVVVVVIAVAGAAAYFALSSGAASTSQASSVSSSSIPLTTTSATSSVTSTATSSTSPSGTVTTSSTTEPTTSSSGSTTSVTSSTASSATTQSSYSCSTTYSTSSGQSVDYTPQYINLIKQYSSMEFKVSDVSNGTANNSTISYRVVNTDGSLYTANFTLSAGGTNESGSAVVDVNALTVQSITVTFGGQTLPPFQGAQAKTYFDTFMALFGLEVTFNNEEGVFTDSAYFHSTGSSTVSFGSVQFPVTTWVANNLPFSLNDCGVTDTITAYTLQVGSPPGTSLNFITYLHVTTTAPNTEDVTFQLVSITVA